VLCCAAVQVSKQVVQLVKLSAGGINFDLELPMQVCAACEGCTHGWMHLYCGCLICALHSNAKASALAPPADKGLLRQVLG
jgi:hypothetical protein